MRAEIDFTDAALEHIAQLRMPTPTIRLGLKPAGCTGFEYVIEWDNIIADSDFKADFGTFKVAINYTSYPKLRGSTVDVVSEGINKTVRILNPQETASCGCGASVNF
jgi:iron-sulfur cluster assembly protein|tara:strand:+ start:1527 stop:1847 length:321 start_codon:yes stop_codon:yes gene_type:complete